MRAHWLHNANNSNKQPSPWPPHSAHGCFSSSPLLAFARLFSPCVMLAKAHTKSFTFFSFSSRYLKWRQNTQTPIHHSNVKRGGEWNNNHRYPSSSHSLSALTNFMLKICFNFMIISLAPSLVLTADRSSDVSFSRQTFRESFLHIQLRHLWLWVGRVPACRSFEVLQTENDFSYGEQPSNSSPLEPLHREDPSPCYRTDNEPHDSMPPIHPKKEHLKLFVMLCVAPLFVRWCFCCRKWARETRTRKKSINKHLSRSIQWHQQRVKNF